MLKEGGSKKCFISSEKCYRIVTLESEVESNRGLGTSDLQAHSALYRQSIILIQV